jgi:hypothetical protein
MHNLPITAVILSEVEGPAVAFAVAVAFLAVIPEGDLLLSVPFSCPFILLATLTLSLLKGSEGDFSAPPHS